MKKITIEINVENSAFEGEHMQWELGRILSELGHKIHNGHMPENLNDINGNKVGIVKVEY